MKLTKSQRHTAYIIMLEELETNLEYQEHGLCYLTCRTIGDLPVLERKMLCYFPEIRKRMPKEYDAYWFGVPPDGLKQRIKVLKQCIEETY